MNRLGFSADNILNVFFMFFFFFFFFFQEKKALTNLFSARDKKISTVCRLLILP